MQTSEGRLIVGAVDTLSQKVGELERRLTELSRRVAYRAPREIGHGSLRSLAIMLCYNYKPNGQKVNRAPCAEGYAGPLPASVARVGGNLQPELGGYFSSGEPLN